MQHKNGPQNLPNFMLYMVRLKGLEPLTYGLEGQKQAFFTLFASTTYLKQYININMLCHNLSINNP